MGKQRLILKSQFATDCGVSAAAITKACKPGGRLEPAAVGKGAGQRVDEAHPVAVEYKAARKSAATGGPDPLYLEAFKFCRGAGFTLAGIRREFGVSHRRAAAIREDMRASGVWAVGAKPAPPAGKAGRSTAPAKRPAGRSVPPAAPPADQPVRRGRAAAADKRKSEAPPELSAPDGGFEIPDHILEFADMTIREAITKCGTDTRLVDILKALQKMEIIHEKQIKSAEKLGHLVSRELVRRGVIEVFNAAHLRLMKDGAKSITATVIAKHDAGFSGPDIEAQVVEMIGAFIAPTKEEVARFLRGVGSD